MKKVFAFFIILISSPIYANVVLNELTQLNSNDINVNWEKVTSHPTNKNHFYVYNYQGIFTEVVNGKTPETHLLDLSKAISQPNINLTAITIHPNFHLKDLPGYQIFYTAHQEPINTESGKTRLPEVPIKNSKYDLVVNEWRLASETLTADLTSQREIIRIASPEQKNTIQKIAFNPNLKPWQDGFSSLYIVLNHTQEYSKIPLYSGAILRITPEEFGLRNYIIPEKNPFKINKNIPDEIIAFGMNNVTDLLWDKTSNEQWFYLETITTETLLKKVKKGHSFESKKSNVLWHYQHAHKQHSIVWYEGEKLTNLVYKFITLEFISGQWQLNSIDVSSKTAIKKTLAPIPSKNNQTQLRLITDNNNELVLLNTTDKTMSEITQIVEPLLSRPKDKPKKVINTQQKSYLIWAFVVLIIFIILLSAYFIVKKIREFDKEKSLVRKLYAKFNFIHHNEEIELFKRHKIQAENVLPVNTIQSCNVLLNNEVIMTIDTKNNVFGEQEKKEVLRRLSLEQRLKMVDNRTRTLTIELIISKTIKHGICVYARKGNLRYTRTGYQESIAILTNFCNIISEKINSNK